MRGLWCCLLLSACATAPQRAADPPPRPPRQVLIPPDAPQFECGPRRCAKGYQVCIVTSPGVPAPPGTKIEPSRYCESLPEDCGEAATCACVRAHRPGISECEEHDGGLVGYAIGA